MQIMEIGVVLPIGLLLFLLCNRCCKKKQAVVRIAPANNIPMSDRSLAYSLQGALAQHNWQRQASGQSTAPLLNSAFCTPVGSRSSSPARSLAIEAVFPQKSPMLPANTKFPGLPSTPMDPTPKISSICSGAVLSLGDLSHGEYDRHRPRSRDLSHTLQPSSSSSSKNKTAKRSSQLQPSPLVREKSHATRKDNQAVKVFLDKHPPLQKSKSYDSLPVKSKEASKPGRHRLRRPSSLRGLDQL